MIQHTFFASVFLMGFLGSWHCGAMCGPLCCNLMKTKDQWKYHLGRLLSYMLLSLLLWRGSSYLFSIQSRWLRLITAISLFLAILFFGLQQVYPEFSKKKSYKIINSFISRVYKSIFPFVKKTPFIMGLATGLLPCMWLYSFLLLASQMGSSLKVMAVVFLFWLSSLPVFFVFAGGINYLVKNAPTKYRYISALVLMLAAGLSISGHWLNI